MENVMCKTITVYDVQYKQTVNRGKSKQVNWVSLATFWTEEEAKKAAGQGDAVIPIKVTEEEAEEICERK